MCSNLCGKLQINVGITPFGRTHLVDVCLDLYIYTIIIANHLFLLCYAYGRRH